MARHAVIPTVGARIGEFLARHPRLVAAVVAALLLLAVQDAAVAVDGVTAEPTASGSADPGPSPPEDTSGD